MKSYIHKKSNPKRGHTCKKLYHGAKNYTAYHGIAPKGNGWTQAVITATVYCGIKTITLFPVVD